MDQEKLLTLTNKNVERIITLSTTKISCINLLNLCILENDFK